MPTLNKDGSTRKKYTTKKMIMKKNRKNGQKKAWDTRRALYPETNGYKPQQVEVSPKVQLPKDVEPEPNQEEEVDYEGRVLTAELAQKLAELDEFLNSVPGVKFDREIFIRDAITTAVELVLTSVAVVCHGQEELTKKLQGMKEFMEDA